jgi:hypothetical protein
VIPIERRVWICQCLCPRRHTILATSGEADSESAAAEAVERPLREIAANMMKSGEINPWCGLCRAPTATWRCELARTRFRSMAEAEPELKRVESDQIATGAAFGEILGRRP